MRGLSHLVLHVVAFIPTFRSCAADTHSLRPPHLTFSDALQRTGCGHGLPGRPAIACQGPHHHRARQWVHIVAQVLAEGRPLPCVCCACSCARGAKTAQLGCLDTNTRAFRQKQTSARLRYTQGVAIVGHTVRGTIVMVSLPLASRYMRYYALHDAFVRAGVSDTFLLLNFPILAPRCRLSLVFFISLSTTRIISLTLALTGGHNCSFGLAPHRSPRHRCTRTGAPDTPLLHILTSLQAVAGVLHQPEHHEHHLPGSRPERGRGVLLPPNRHPGQPRPGDGGGHLQCRPRPPAYHDLVCLVRGHTPAARCRRPVRRRVM